MINDFSQNELPEKDTFPHSGDLDSEDPTYRSYRCNHTPVAHWANLMVQPSANAACLSPCPAAKSIAGNTERQVMHLRKSAGFRQLHRTKKRRNSLKRWRSHLRVRSVRIGRREWKHLVLGLRKEERKSWLFLSQKDTVGLAGGKISGVAVKTHLGAYRLLEPQTTVSSELRGNLWSILGHDSGYRSSGYVRLIIPWVQCLFQDRKSVV